MANIHADVDMKNVLGKANATLNVTVKFHRVRQFRWRLKVAMWLCRLAAQIAWLDFKLETQTTAQSWLYYCPNCQRDFVDDKPEAGQEFCICCRHCDYQFLATGNPDHPIVHTDDYQVSCGFSCGWVSPYGFVADKTCPVHGKDSYVD